MCQGACADSQSNDTSCSSSSLATNKLGQTKAEDELAALVPVLLDTMNRSSTEANSLENRAAEAHRRYKVQLIEVEQLYENMRLQQGQAFSKIKPYYFANQELKAASHHVQALALEFSEAAQQYEKVEKESEASATSAAGREITKLKAERDKLEELYGKSLRHYQAAQKVLDAQRAQLGDDMISRALPHFEMLQERQMCLAVEYNRINTLVERGRVARCAYKSSMCELERISESIHNIRQGHDLAAGPTAVF